MKPIKIAFGSAALLLMLSAGTAVNAAGLKQGQKAPARTTEAVSTRTVQSSKKQAAAKPTQHKGYQKPAAQAQPAQPKAKQASSQASANTLPRLSKEKSATARRSRSNASA